MIIKSKYQAADQGTHGPILLAAWEAGETSVTVGGKEYEFVREVEPVEMYTGEELLVKALESHPEWRREQSEAAHRFMETVRDLILARRVEMLRAMGDEGLVEKLYDDTEIVYDQLTRRGTRDLIALITEHIEANRPVLTNEMIESWYSDWVRCDGQDDDLEYYIAHRAAEYRSPAVAELRAENERLKIDVEKTKSSYDVWMKTAKSLGEELDALKATRSPQPVDNKRTIT